MKKQIIISSIAAVALWSGTALLVMNNADARKPEDSATTNLLASEQSALPTTERKLSVSGDETVFVIADESGATKSKFIGNTLYTGTETLPFDFKITYYLDGNEISAKDLSGKSGHVKIVYSYNSNATYLSKNIPFLALTGLTLDRTNFSNIKLTNGKILTETTDNLIITGYAITGLNNNLGTELLPESFTLEADTTNFKLTDSYTIFTNSLIADIDTSKLNSIDSLINSLYELEDGLNKIIAGSSELSQGLATALDGTKTLYDGSKTLAAGAATAATGAATLSDGLNTLVSNNSAIQNGANTLIDTILGKANNALALLKRFGIPIEIDQITTENYQYVYETIITKIDTYRSYIHDFLEKLGLPTDQKTIISALVDDAVEALTGLKNIIDLNLGIIDYTNGVAAAAAGASTLSDGLSDLSNGATTLSDGLGSLYEGTSKLYTGSITLNEGLNTFKTSGIDKLVNFAATDLSRFIANIRGSVTAASNYKNFGGADAKSVKFIIKTPSIK